MIKLPCYHALALFDKKTLSCLLTNPISMSVYRGGIAERKRQLGRRSSPDAAEEDKALLAESGPRKESINYSEGAAESSGL
jgi:hypothetical protein